MIIKIRIGDKENLRVEIIEDFHVYFYFYIKNCLQIEKHKNRQILQYRVEKIGLLVGHLPLTYQKLSP